MKIVNTAQGQIWLRPIAGVLADTEFVNALLAAGTKLPFNAANIQPGNPPPDTSDGSLNKLPVAVTAMEKFWAALEVGETAQTALQSAMGIASASLLITSMGPVAAAVAGTAAAVATVQNLGASLSRVSKLITKVWGTTNPAFVNMANGVLDTLTDMDVKTLLGTEETDDPTTGVTTAFDSTTLTFVDMLYLFASAALASDAGDVTTVTVRTFFTLMLPPDLQDVVAKLRQQQGLLGNSDNGTLANREFGRRQIITFLMLRKFGARNPMTAQETAVYKEVMLAHTDVLKAGHLQTLLSNAPDTYKIISDQMLTALTGSERNKANMQAFYNSVDYLRDRSGIFGSNEWNNIAIAQMGCLGQSMNMQLMGCLQSAVGLVAPSTDLVPVGQSNVVTQGLLGLFASTYQITLAIERVDPVMAYQFASQRPFDPYFVTTREMRLYIQQYTIPFAQSQGQGYVQTVKQLQGAQNGYHPGTIKPDSAFGSYLLQNKVIQNTRGIPYNDTTQQAPDQPNTGLPGSTSGSLFGPINQGQPGNYGTYGANSINESLLGYLGLKDPNDPYSLTRQNLGMATKGADDRRLFRVDKVTVNPYWKNALNGRSINSLTLEEQANPAVQKYLGVLQDFQNAIVNDEGTEVKELKYNLQDIGYIPNTSKFNTVQAMPYRASKSEKQTFTVNPLLQPKVDQLTMLKEEAVQQERKHVSALNDVLEEADDQENEIRDHQQNLYVPLATQKLARVGDHTPKQWTATVQRNEKRQAPMMDSQFMKMSLIKRRKLEADQSLITVTTSQPSPNVLPKF